MKIKLNKNASFEQKINYLKLKYGVEGEAQYITRQVARQNKYDAKIQFAYEMFGENVKTIIGKENYIAIYQNTNCGSIIINCIEVVDDAGIVLERLL